MFQNNTSSFKMLWNSIAVFPVFFLETIDAVEVDAISQISCNFDRDFCGWTNDSGAEFTWSKNKGTTPSDGTGPPWDHTTKSRS